MLTKEELQKIIDQFDEEELKRIGVFGILRYGGGPDESFIKANKEGLEIFALELLKAAKETESILADSDKNIITNLNFDEDWVHEDSEVLINYIEPIAEKQKSITELHHQESFSDKLISIGCLAVLLLLVISTLVGLVTIIKWFW